jgi:hypothetical protein
VLNTIVSLLWQFYGKNNAIHVAAPTGSAAYQIGGETLHSLCSISSTAKTTVLKGKQLSDTRKKFDGSRALFIDKWSQLSAKVLGASEYVVSKCINFDDCNGEDWGGLPVVVIMGDDYQLPPVKQHGAFSMYDTAITNCGICDETRGFILFQKNLQDVMQLTHSLWQKEEEVVTLLNNVWHNTLTMEQSQFL